MSRAPFTLALLLLAAAAGCDRDASFARMVRQPRADPYEGSEAFADGAAMRAPPAGTVPRGAPEDDPPRLEGRAAASGKPLERIPVTITADLLARGRDRFAIYCAACHGPGGDGRSAVARHMTLRAPPSLLERVERDPPGSIFRAIGEGFGLMPGYAWALDVDDRWAVTAYLRALHLSRRAPLARLPAEVRRRAKERLP